MKWLVVITIVFTTCSFGRVGAEPIESTMPASEPGDSEPVQKEVVIVEGKSIEESQEESSVGFIEAKTKQPNTESSLTKEGIRLFGGPGQTDPQKALNVLPSVIAESADPFGITGNKEIMIRGKPSFNLQTTVEGVPLRQLFPFSDEMFDLENVQTLTLYRGAVPVDKGLGANNTSGVINETLARPLDKPSVMAKESIGSFEFNRTFLRLDTGVLPSKSKVFMSYSYTSANLWRGPGQSPHLRDNVELGLTQELTSRAKLELFGVYNRALANNYRPLTFAQASNPSLFSTINYNSTLTGVPAQDINYFNFNKQGAEYFGVLGNLAFNLGSHSEFAIKPYWLHETGFLQFGLPFTMGQPIPGFRVFPIKHSVYGVVSEYKTSLLSNDLTFGYWYDETEPPPEPPLFQDYHTTVSGQPQFAGNPIASQMHNNITHSPYVTLKREIGKAQVTAGLRYLYMTFPAGSTSLINPALNVERKELTTLIPNVGITYPLSETTNARFAYGRNYARPDVGPQVTAFANQLAQFQAKGITLQNILDRLSLQTSDNFDLGLTYNRSSWYLAPTLFSAFYHHKELTVTDPNNGLSFFQSNGRAFAYGAELEVGAKPVEKLTLFASASYNRMELTNNIQTGTSTFIMSKDKQAQGTPRYTAKAGATYEIYNFAISPVVRAIGGRYGDIQNTQYIPSYVVADLYLNYSVPLPPQLKTYTRIKDLIATASFLNVLDKRYIGVIQFDHVQLTGSSAYFPGAPFTTVFSLTGQF